MVSGKVADVEAKVEVGGEISAKDGASVNASAAVSHGGVEVGRGVSANGEGVKAGTRVGAGANKDFKVGAKLRLVLGFGVKVNVTQAWPLPIPGTFLRTWQLLGGSSPPRRASSIEVAGLGASK